MSDKVNLSTFPSSKVSALAMLYLQNQDFSNSTPEEIADKYTESYARIQARFKEARNEKAVSFLK